MAINRDKFCSNIHGGSSELYIFEYQKYKRSDVKIVDNYLTSFPYSVIYNLNALNITFTETVDSEDGGTTFSQSGGFQLNKITPTDDYKKFVDKDWRIILKDNNGYYRILGLETGLKLKYTKENGGGLNEFNGFKFTFSTKEENTAPFLSDLSMFFIDNLPLIGTENNDFIGTNNNEIIEAYI